jgi:excisionase family DNA binding protein
MTTLPLDSLMRRSVVAELLDVSERTVCRWGAAGRLDERKIGPRAVRVTKASVERLLSAATGAEREDR